MKQDSQDTARNHRQTAERVEELGNVDGYFIVVLAPVHRATRLPPKAWMVAGMLIDQVQLGTGVLVSKPVLIPGLDSQPARYATKPPS
jgi:hypothetical protein